MKTAVEIPYHAHGARGAARYGEYLVRSLGRSFPDDRFAVVNYFSRDYETHLARFAGLRAANVELLIPRWPQKGVAFAEGSLGWPIVEPKLVRPWGAEVFHHMGTHPIGETPAVVTFFGAAMDPIYGFDRFFTERVLPQLLKASRVIAVSHCLRDILLKYFPFQPSRVEMIYFGVDHERFKPRPAGPALEAVRAKYKLPERFLLSVGPFQFRDNVEHLMQVLKERGDSAAFKGVKLVLAGGDSEYGPRLREHARALGIADKVVFPGYVAHEDLALVFNLAEAFVHCSYFEELGLQMLEAGASGCAIVASRVAGIGEAVGEGAVYFNPTQLSELASALESVLGSAERRRELSGRAVEHSKRFDWDDAARRTRGVYAAAAREGNAR